jgi:type I restriction enzyme S subunit
VELAVAAIAENDETADGPWQLPEGWVATKLEDIVERLTDGTHQPPTFTASGIPFVVIGNVSGDGIDWSSVKKWVSPSTYLSESKRLRPSQDDILYTAVGSYGLAIRVLDDREFMFQRHIAYLRPNKNLVDPAYLCHALNSPMLRRQADHVARGVAQKTVTLGSLREFDVPLAPLAEQRRIVARVDALFAEIAEGEEALVAARKGLEIFRRALLKAAVTGELTKDWRASNPVAETGHDLLARIANDFTAKAPTKIRGRQNADDTPLDLGALPALPSSWAWATVRGVGAVQLGRQRAPQHHTGENMRPYLRVANVFEDRIDFTDVKEMNFTPAEFQTYELKPGDILLNEGQTPDLLGRPAMWRGEFKGYCFQNTLLRFQVRAPMSAEFCLLVFRHYLHAKRFKRESQITTNIAHLSSGRFVTIEFPVPPLDEQTEIVRRVSEGLAAAADTLAGLDAEAADSARLRQSILKAAFEGRLVLQDPTDESAGARLAANPVVTTVRRGRTRKSDA